MEVALQNISVLGPGLMGTSLVQSIRKNLPESRIQVWGRTEQSLRAVKDGGWADLVTTSLEEAIAGATLIVLATPVKAMSVLAGKFPLKDGSEEVVITDLGSVKMEVEGDVAQPLRDAGYHFVGAHPMCGSERQGGFHGRADLYEGAPCIISTDGSESDAVALVRTFWQKVGCRTIDLSSKEHDELIAFASHMPHVASSAVALAALDGQPDLPEVAGTGIRDTTRVAAGSPDMWTEILLSNQAMVLRAMETLRQRIEEIMGALEAGDSERLRTLLDRARNLREQLNSNNNVEP